jgi:hypothetical protein
MFETFYLSFKDITSTYLHNSSSFIEHLISIGVTGRIVARYPGFLLSEE